jgi:hypothetical protein
MEGDGQGEKSSDRQDDSDRSIGRRWTTALGGNRKRHNDRRSDSENDEEMAPTTKQRDLRERSNSDIASFMNGEKAYNGVEPPSAQPRNYGYGMTQKSRSQSSIIDSESVDSQLSAPTMNPTSRVDGQKGLIGDTTVKVAEAGKSGNNLGQNPLQNAAAINTTEEEISSLWCRLSALQVRLVNASGRKDVADQIYHPERSELNVDEFEAHFQNEIDGALRRISDTVRTKFAKLADMSSEHRVQALISLRGLKNNLINKLIRIRDGSFWAHNDGRLASINAAYSELSNVNEVRATQQESFASISKATVGIHYARVLRVVQNRMRVLTDSLTDSEVGKSTIENAAYIESERKLIAISRNLRKIGATLREQQPKSESNVTVQNGPRRGEASTRQSPLANPNPDLVTKNRIRTHQRESRVVQARKRYNNAQATYRNSSSHSFVANSPHSPVADQRGGYPSTGIYAGAEQHDFRTSNAHKYEFNSKVHQRINPTSVPALYNGQAKRLFEVSRDYRASLLGPPPNPGNIRYAESERAHFQFRSGRFGGPTSYGGYWYPRY